MAGHVKLSHLTRAFRLYLPIRPGPEVKAKQVFQATTQAFAEIVSGNNKILPPIIDASDKDVSVWTPGIKMIHGNPLQAGSQVFLHLRHQTSRQVSEVVILLPVFRRHDKPKLVTVAFAAGHEITPLDVFAVAVIKLPPGTGSRNAIALQVAQVTGRRRNTLPSQAREPRLDDAPTTAQAQPRPIAEDKRDARAASPKRSPFSTVLTTGRRMANAARPMRRAQGPEAVRRSLSAPYATQTRPDFIVIDHDTQTPHSNQALKPN
ncbi:MAG TPA: hypothetical protein VN042_07600 [Asticcacaulis sp.]|nr:hypothetical protein [Asticcacaulis sp.]